jgi:hypothetical protein
MIQKDTISMIIYSIYKIVNQITGKIYIGITKQANKRFNKHINHANSKPQLLIQKKIRQYGKDNFTFHIIFQTKDIEYCKIMESYFITEYDTLAPKGYNIHTGGNYCPIKTRDNCRQRMLLNNPGNTEESIKKKTSTILAFNYNTKESIIVANRKEFAKQNNLEYTSIGWALQNKKPLKNEWFFTYINKRTMGA